MISDSVKTAVPVDMLRPGLYVMELDRPWVDTPFLFQGFRIVGDEELRALQKYCRVVYIDMERSDRAAREATVAELRQQDEDITERLPDPVPEPRRPSEDERRRSVGALFEDVPHPDHGRFSTLVHAAHATRQEARRAIDEAFRHAIRGGRIDAASVRHTVEQVAATILEDATAALWLTHLRDRDDYLATHSVNVCILAVALGSHLGMKRAALTHLGIGALLHDVGKMRLPRGILDKPGKLTDLEMDAVRQYPEEGYEMVSANGGVPHAALEIIRLHQERWAGHGYPQGLLGEMIPRGALITGLADAYDAMTSDRPWRPAMPPDRALHELYENASRDFGSELVQVFIRCLGTFPVGSIVELDNGSIGVVIGTRPEAGLRPTVLMMRTPDGEPYQKRLLLNLAAEGRARFDLTGRRIRRAMSPGEAGIDLHSIIVEDFALAA